MTQPTRLNARTPKCIRVFRRAISACPTFISKYTTFELHYNLRMHTRLLVRDDVSNAAHVAVAAYVDDAQDAYIYPKRHEYPLRYLKVKTDIIQHSLEDSIALPIVAVLEPNDEGWNGTPEIMGFCIWYREGADQNEEEAQNRDAQKKKPWISSEYYHDSHTTKPLIRIHRD